MAKMPPLSRHSTCNCTPSRPCSRHLTLQQTTIHDGQRSPHQYMGGLVASDTFVGASEPYSHDQSSTLEGSAMSEGWVMAMQGWNLNQNLNTASGLPVADSIPSTHTSANLRDFQMRSASDSYVQHLSMAQHYQQSAFPEPTVLAHLSPIGSLNRSLSLDSSPYMPLPQGHLPSNYSLMHSQAWRPEQQAPTERLWQEPSVSHNDSAGNSPRSGVRPSAQLQHTPTQHVQYQLPTNAPEQWHGPPSSNTRGISEQMSPIAAPYLMTAIPSRYWMVRNDSRVVESNGLLAIELDSPGREMVPAVRFEDVFQDALQNNLTTPASMREAWQLENQSTTGRPLVKYNGPSTTGINRSRKSTVFAPFVTTVPPSFRTAHQPQPPQAIVLIDDKTPSGQPFLRPLRSSPYLPDTISTREAGWLIEAILRRDWTITLEDVMDRMLSRIRLDISTYNRWRRQDKAVYDFEDEPRSRYGA